MKKRILALLLAASLSVSLVSASAAAAEERVTDAIIAAQTVDADQIAAMEAQLAAGQTGQALQAEIGEEISADFVSPLASVNSTVVPWSIYYGASFAQNTAENSLIFTMNKFSDTDQDYVVAILGENNTVMGSSRGSIVATELHKLTITFDTFDANGTVWPVGDYTVNCYTTAPNDPTAITGTLASFVIHVVASPVACRGLYFYDVNGEPLDDTTAILNTASNVPFYVGVAPSASTSGRDVTVTVSDNNVVTSRVVGSSVYLTARALGTATITAVNTTGQSVTLTVNVTEPVPVTGIAMNPASTSVIAGDTVTLEARRIPANAEQSPIVFRSSNTAVATVDDSGKVTGLSAGVTTITASCGGFSTTCTVTVTGSLLHFTDLVAGSWYYPSVRYATENGLFNGVAPTLFAPETTMNRAMLVTVLYRMAGSPTVSTGSPFVDVSSPSAYYYNPVIWANSLGIATGRSSTVFDPDASVSRQEMATFLYRYHTLYKLQSVSNSAELDGYDDVGQMQAYAFVPMSWSVGNELINGVSETELSPATNANRAQVATLLTRYCTKFGR